MNFSDDMGRRNIGQRYPRFDDMFDTGSQFGESCQDPLENDPRLRAGVARMQSRAARSARAVWRRQIQIDKHGPAGFPEKEFLQFLADYPSVAR